MSPEEINNLLAKSRDQKFRKKSEAQLEGYSKSSISNKLYKEANPISDEMRSRLSKSLKGKSFDDRVGIEKAESQKKSRSNKLKGKSRPTEVVEKIVATKKLNGVYENENHGMRNKKHSEETLAKMRIKAKEREEKKRLLRNLDK
jgi:hypothetical protein